MIGSKYRGAKALIVTAVCALFAPTLALCCPVPHDADSNYHTLSRLSRLAPKLGVTASKTPVSRDPAHASPCEGGMADDYYPCNNVDLESYLPMSSIGGGEANDIWGWTDSVTGKEYALIGKTNGTAFVDISDPHHAEYLGTLPTQTTNSSWRDLKTFGNYVFIVSEADGHGMQVFDLTELRSVATPRTFSATAVYTEFGSAHNIAINEQSGFAYALGTRNVDDGCAGGLHIIDVSRPAVPEFAGCYSGDGYTHDTQCVNYDGPDQAYQGREICFNFNEDTLTIVDVTDKSTPQQLARQPYSGSSYTHQGWITDDQRYLLLDDEADELTFGHNTRTYIWDLSQLQSPQVINSYLAGTAAIDHNLYIKGNFAYQANYRAGLRILDLSNIGTGSIVENGFFDVYPSSNSAAFNGSWSVYPYFDSGLVIVSGIEQGLFVLRPTALEPGFLLVAASKTVAVCGENVGSSFLTVDPVGSYSGSVGLQSSGQPAGVLTSFTPQTVSPPANTIFSVSVENAQPGIYPITISGIDGDLRFDEALSLQLSTQAPAQPELLLPALGASGVTGIQTLYWSAVPGAFEYDVEVASDIGFTQPVMTATGLKQRRFTPQAALNSETTFYWRVTAHNACGSEVSQVGSFTTVAPQCTVYMSSDVPKIIPSSSSTTVDSMLTTNTSGTIVDVNVIGLTASHTWINDIDIRLEGPFNTAHENSRHPERPAVLIMAQSCNNENDLDINFDDEAAPATLPCPPTDGGYYLPANPLAAFDGSSGAGEWNLQVTDNFPADGGALESWGLELCTAPVAQVLDMDNDAVDDLIDNCLLVSNPDQRDTNGDGFGNVCDADLNNDGIVNLDDMGLLRAAFWQFGDLDADFSGDGHVNLDDIALMRVSFFGPPGPSAVAQ